MGTILGILAGLVVVALLVYFFAFRGKEGELPQETRQKEPEARAKKPAPSRDVVARDAVPAKKEPAAKKALAVAEEEAGPEEAGPHEEAAPEEASAKPAARAKAPPPAEKKAPTDEDIKALKKGLASTRGGFIARLANVFRKKKDIDPELLDELQEILITADIGVKTSERILGQLRARMDNNELADEDRVWEALRHEARTILDVATPGLRLSESPSLIIVVGVNGVGKTTTIGKLASRFKEEGKTVILAAGDTFRAAAVPQLDVWGRRVGCEVVKGKRNADPGSVIFDAVKKARDENADIVIADTAGRLHTKSNLMDELKKVVRSGEKALGRKVDEVLLVLDSTTGQNAIQQAQQFKDAIDVSGIALTKLDGTAKGGVILGIVHSHGLPVHFIGVGERVEDLREFDAASFVEALFAKPDDHVAAA